MPLSNHSSGADFRHMKRANKQRVRYLAGLTLFCLALIPATLAKTPKPAQRQIEIDVAQAGRPFDRFFDLSVGSDFPGTLIREDSQLQLKKAVDELGFRYIRFHAIFHDVLGTVRVENGKTIYDWTKIDQLYDDLLARRIKPFVELGFTPKAIDPNLRVGGPSTAGAAWVPELLDHVTQSGAAVDFVTTHSYGVDGGFLDENGKEDIKLSPSPDAIVGDVRKVRQQIKDSTFPDLPLYFTEWSTSYNPRDLVHDSYISAPYILSKLKAAEGLVQGMSYWTYTDLFEEPGPPPTPFHGGFGLFNREGIRKPAYFAYKYLHAVQGNEIPLPDSQAFAAIDNDRVATVIWDFQQPEQKVSNRPFYSRIVPAVPAPSLHVTFKNLSSGIYRLEVHRTGFRANDAYSRYIDMGAPRELTPTQLDQLNSLTRDLPEINRVVKVGKKGSYTLSLPMRSNDVVLVTVEKVTK